MEAKDFEQFKRGDVLTVTADSGERWIIIYGYVKDNEIYASVGYDTESDYRYAGREEEFFDCIEHLSSVEKSSAEEFNELCDFLDRENVGYYVILEDRKIIISGENMEGKKENGAKAFEGITQEMVDLHSRKNNDYGNAYQEMLDFAGIDAGIGIMYNKLKRLKTLVSIGERQVKEESIEDTLIDLANYSVMTLEYIRNKK